VWQTNLLWQILVAPIDVDQSGSDQQQQQRLELASGRIDLGSN